MKKLLYAFLLLPFFTGLLQAEDWSTDYQASLDQAKKEHKLVLLDFTGSDWCPACMLLHKEVLSNPAFKDFLSKSFVPVTVDFPRNSKLPDKVAKQNDKLQEYFGVEAFPTLIVVNSDGKSLGHITGYMPGSGPKTVTEQLQGIMEKK